MEVALFNQHFDDIAWHRRGERLFCHQLGARAGVTQAVDLLPDKVLGAVRQYRLRHLACIGHCLGFFAEKSHHSLLYAW